MIELENNRNLCCHLEEFLYNLNIFNVLSISFIFSRQAKQLLTHTKPSVLLNKLVVFYLL